MADPLSARPVRFPAGYGTVTPSDLLPWLWVEDRLRPARNYWLTTVGPDGRPHARPIDGVWVEGALCFGGSPDARWVRNLMVNPAASINLSSETEAIILEGIAQHVMDPTHPLAAPSMAASREKYPQYFRADAPFHPFWTLRPSTAYAWTLENFPRGATRWSFEAR